MKLHRPSIAAISAAVFLSSFVSGIIQNKISPNVAQAQIALPPFNNMKSIDVMKYSKDTMTNQPSDAEIDNLIGTLATAHVTDIALSIPMDSSADYPANSKPYPRDAYQETQVWANIIHSHGLHIIWRGTWSGIEGIYGFTQLVGSNRFTAGTAQSAATDGNSTWLGKTYQYIVNNPGFFQDGDVWAPLPERTEGIFQDSTSFLPYSGAGIQANYASFFSDLKTASDAAFAKIGKNILTGMSANNYSEVLSGWLPQSLFDNTGVVAIDYYGVSHTPQEMDQDLRAMSAAKGKPIFLQEWGDYWNTSLSQTDRTLYLNSMYAEMQNLVNDGVLAGFNYWGGWDNDAEGLLTQDSGGFHLNYRGQMLSNFFAANGGSGITLISTNLTCPAPGTNVFTGCYYQDMNFSKLGLVRTDPAINFDWGTGSPDPAIPADHFSAAWSGAFNFSPAKYTFSVTADDGIRLYVDGGLVIDQWLDQAATTYKVTKRLSGGAHQIKVEYYEDAGGAIAKVSWSKN